MIKHLPPTHSSSQGCRRRRHVESFERSIRRPWLRGQRVLVIHFRAFGPSCHAHHEGAPAGMAGRVTRQFMPGYVMNESNHESKTKPNQTKSNQIKSNQSNGSVRLLLSSNSTDGNISYHHKNSLPTQGQTGLRGGSLRHVRRLHRRGAEAAEKGSRGSKLACGVMYDGLNDGGLRTSGRSTGRYPGGAHGATWTCCSPSAWGSSSVTRRRPSPTTARACGTSCG